MDIANEILFYISIFITIITFLALSIYPNLDYLKPILVGFEEQELKDEIERLIRERM